MLLLHEYNTLSFLELNILIVWSENSQLEYVFQSGSSVKLKITTIKQASSLHFIWSTFLYLKGFFYLFI